MSVTFQWLFDNFAVQYRAVQPGCDASVRSSAKHRVHPGSELPCRARGFRGLQHRPAATYALQSPTSQPPHRTQPGM